MSQFGIPTIEYIIIDKPNLFVYLFQTLSKKVHAGVPYSKILALRPKMTQNDPEWPNQPNYGEEGSILYSREYFITPFPSQKKTLPKFDTEAQKGHSEVSSLFS